LIGHDYWAAAQHEKYPHNVGLLRKDLARPFFELYGACTRCFESRFPAYAGADLLFSAINWRASCDEA
jgi:hypothetical protein